MGGFVTPADSGTLTNFVEIGQAQNKILSLKLDQVSFKRTAEKQAPKCSLTCSDFWYCHIVGNVHLS
jgi:hypothetical protein